ncbi:RraA family protein [Maritimibacter sp. UBA3975]|uniref:RraA family protein n=1 Tax=Maritimibacter sp. UBA3975 TaxID=1946833 RepID=UPI000C0B8723|nr:RraA family protein [Maritimibacter sp. UBA3975]MAM63142.1 methyltransferase [Maritimibacter sp.]|tara:strand:- start:454 stop:1242 length:789 start_codon:yes stop_codon:yes gene_type:complete
MDFRDIDVRSDTSKDNVSSKFLKPGATNSLPKSADISPGPGFMVRTRFDRPDADVVAGFEHFESTDISDSLNRLYAMGPGIHNVVNDAPLCGPVCTVKVYPGDNLMVHKILDIAQPGDVVVVDGSGSMNAALIGDLVSNKARHRGIQGFIIDGLVRDLPGLRECGLPIYARGVTPFGPLHRGPGEINYPVACGGIVVNPGDIVRADPSGVAVVPRDWAPEILKRLRAGEEKLAAYTANVKRGVFSNAWVDDQLEAAGCIFDD